MWLRDRTDWRDLRGFGVVVRRRRHRTRDYRSSLRSVITGVPVPAIPSWLLEPLWDQFAALLPDRPVYHPSHPLGCHKPRIADRDHLRKADPGPAVRLLV